MANVDEAYAFLAIWYDELMRKNWYTSMTAGHKNPFVDGVVTKGGGFNQKIKVKLTGGTEVSVSTGSYGNIRTNAYVLLLKHFKLLNYINGVPNYVVNSYEVIGVRYKNSDGTVTKTYRN